VLKDAQKDNLSRTEIVCFNVTLTSMRISLRVHVNNVQIIVQNVKAMPFHVQHVLRIRFMISQIYIV
jgi:hypothetical protein